MIDSLSEHLAVVAGDGTIVAVNQSWLQFSQLNGGGEIGSGWNYLAVCDASAAAGEPLAAEAAALIRDVMRGVQSTGTLVYPCHSPDVSRWFEMRVDRVGWDRSHTVVVQHLDITREYTLRRDRSLQARLLDDVDVSVVALDGEKRVAYWNAGAARLYGWSRDGALGQPFERLVAVEALEESQSRSNALRLDGMSEHSVRLHNGSVVPVQIRTSLVSDGETEWTVEVAADATGRSLYETELRSTRDYMRAVTESIPEGLFSLADDGTVAYMNPEAERILGWTAAELQGQRMHDLTHYKDADGDACTFEDCPITLSRVERRVVDSNDDVFITKTGETIPVAFKASPFETASGQAGTVVIFRDITEQKAAAERQELEVRELSWAGLVREALEQDTFTLYAQPIVDIATRRIESHELLLRLRSGDKVVAPDVFLPAARLHDLMPEIDQWVFREALRIAGGSQIEINLSAESLSSPTHFKRIERLLHESNIAPSQIVIEITESSLLTSEKSAGLLLDRLADKGYKIALDDFGTGFGGFTYLKHLPIHYLKIDREFVRELASDETSQAVVHAVVNLARGFGQKTIAEGVEDEAALAILATLGVDYAQGYLFAKPRPAEHQLRRNEKDTT